MQSATYLLGKNAESISPITLHIAQLAANTAALTATAKNGIGVFSKKSNGPESESILLGHNGIKQAKTAAKISIPLRTVINALTNVTTTFETAYFTVPQRVMYIFEAEQLHSSAKFAANGNAPNIAMTFLSVSKQSSSSN